MALLRPPPECYDEVMRKPGLVVYVVVGTAFHLGLYSALALVFGRRDRRRGWRDGRPGPLNRAGIALVATGAAVLGSAVLGHHRAAPERTSIATTSTYLAQGGAYSFTRNPLYLGGMTAWAGWAIFLGSRRSIAVATMWATVLALVGVPYEERKLTATFGDSYRAYCDKVPRWL